MSIRTRAVAGSCLGSVVGGILGIVVGAMIGAHHAESTFREGVQGPILIGFLISLIAAIAEFGIAAVTGGLIGSLLGGILGTVVSTFFLHEKAEPADGKAPPGPEESLTETSADEPQSRPHTPTAADEQS